MSENFIDLSIVEKGFIAPNQREISHFLKELFLIHKEYRMLEDREEKFNIFSVLHKEHDERRLHSRFISTLLQPQGTHGLKIKFLRNFFSLLLDISNPNEEESNSKNQHEELIKFFLVSESTTVYPTERSKKENNNIDILIIDRDKKFAVIIENKIYAGDSNLEGGGQIERYITHVIENENIPLENILAIYLSLDGHEPTPTSLGKYKDKNRHLILGYPEIISPWLEECLKDSVTKPFLREALIQYKKLIDKMTNNSSKIEERLAIKDLIGKSNDSMKATKELLDNFKHVKWHTVYEFLKGVEDELVNNEWEVILKNGKLPIDQQEGVIHDITHNSNQKKKQKLYLPFRPFPSGPIVDIIYSGYHHFYYAVRKGRLENKSFEMGLKNIVENSHNNYSSNDWMYIEKVFDRNFKLNDFSDEETFWLIKKDKREKAIKDTMKEVEGFVELLKNTFK